MSSSNSLRQLVFSTGKCSLTEGGKDWVLLPLNDCNFLKSPCMPLGTTQQSVRVKSHPQQGRLHDSLIVKLSGIGSIQIFNCSVLSPVVFHRMAIKCFSIFAAASGVYPEVFAWSGIGILLYILSYRIKKRKKLTNEL